jgi:ElaB/YqjD/DUF883 family membrane-anchored ribosome-binding protein
MDPLTEMLKTILPCFGRAPKLTADKPSNLTSDGKTGGNIVHYEFLSEKTGYMKRRQFTTQERECASRVVSTLTLAKKADLALEATIQDIVHQAGGWSEWCAAAILSALETVLKAGSEMNAAMQEAYEKACDAAKAIEGFAAEHPIATAVFCTVIALGVLVVLAPYVVEALGFGELGPVAGKCGRICKYGMI